MIGEITDGYFLWVKQIQDSPYAVHVPTGKLVKLHVASIHEPFITVSKPFSDELRPEIWEVPSKKLRWLSAMEVIAFQGRA